MVQKHGIIHWMTKVLLNPLLAVTAPSAPTKRGSVGGRDGSSEYPVFYLFLNRISRSLFQENVLGGGRYSAVHRITVT